MRTKSMLGLLIVCLSLSMAIQAEELKFNPADIVEVETILGNSESRPAVPHYRPGFASARRGVFSSDGFVELGALQLNGRSDRIGEYGAFATRSVEVSGLELEIEMALDESKTLYREFAGDAISVELDLGEIDAFLGLNADRELVRVAREDAVEFLSNPANPTLCGDRKLVAYGTMSLSGGAESVVAVGINVNTTQPGTQSASQTTSSACPFFSWQQGCDSSGCTFRVTINFGIGSISMTYSGYCVPNYAAGLPVLCICSPVDINPWHMSAGEEFVD